MTESSRNFAVGLTAIAGLMGLGFLVVLFGYTPQLLERNYPIVVHMATSGGLNESNGVTMSGIEIGRIASVRLAEPEGNGVVVRALIRKDIRIPRDAKVLVSAPLFTGGASLAFDTSELTEAQRSEYLPTDGSATIEGRVVDFSTSFRDMLVEPLKNLDRISASFESLANEWAKVGTSIGAMVEQRDVAAVDRGEAVANLSTVLRRADADLAELRTMLARINMVLGDEKFIGDIKLTATNAAALTGKYAHVADQLAVAITSMNKAIEQARTGEGTVGKLMADPALYNNLNDAAQRLGTALTELNNLLTKMKNEGLPLKFE